MNKTAIILACLVCAGQARELMSQDKLAKLLLALQPSDGFKPMTPGNMNRRELLSRASAGLAGMAFAQKAFAKQGEFSGVDALSTGAFSIPYRTGDAPVVGDERTGASFGLPKEEGEPIDQGWRKDQLDLMKADLAESEVKFAQVGKYVDEGSWFNAGDDLREQAYTMRKSMKQLTDLVNKKPVTKAYDTFWDSVGVLGVAIRNKDLKRSQKDYAKALALYGEWKKIAV
mmetsp:Transcript_31060/g.54908  ORF Transcript_31060/g.54908 Transcript_31060/m.54908 type:complete len:229 (-) Transcript_31060:402-1088(-)